MTEYGRIHTDGSQSGGQPVVDAATCRGSWTLGTACGKCSRCVATEMTNENKYPSGGSGTGLQTVVIRKGMAACTDRIGGAGVVTHGVVGVVTQSDALQADALDFGNELIFACAGLRHEPIDTEAIFSITWDGFPYDVTIRAAKGQNE